MTGWRIEGYDTFDNSWYSIAGEYATKEEALRVAHAELRKLEHHQPTAESGGQAGIQDRVYVVGPDGTGYRVFPPRPESWADRLVRWWRGA
jgi:hypothetical protein